MSILLGNKLKILRKKKKMTLQELAKASGSTKSYIWELEKGDIKKPSFEKIIHISNALNVGIDYFADKQRSIYNMISDFGDIIGNNLIITGIELKGDVIYPYVIIQLAKRSYINDKKPPIPIGQLNLDKVQYYSLRGAIEPLLEFKSFEL